MAGTALRPRHRATAAVRGTAGPRLPPAPAARAPSLPQLTNNKTTPWSVSLTSTIYTKGYRNKISFCTALTSASEGVAGTGGAGADGVRGTAGTADTGRAGTATAALRRAVGDSFVFSAASRSALGNSNSGLRSRSHCRDLSARVEGEGHEEGETPFTLTTLHATLHVP